MNGFMRVKNKFLWWPVKDNNKWYWLRRVKIVQRLQIYDIIEYPLIPWGFGGPKKYHEYEWEFVGIIDEENAIEVFIPDKDSPSP